MGRHGQLHLKSTYGYVHTDTLTYILFVFALTFACWKMRSSLLPDMSWKLLVSLNIKSKQVIYNIRYVGKSFWLFEVSMRQMNGIWLLSLIIGSTGFYMKQSSAVGFFGFEGFSGWGGMLNFKHAFLLCGWGLCVYCWHVMAACVLLKIIFCLYCFQNVFFAKWLSVKLPGTGLGKCSS